MLPVLPYLYNRSSGRKSTWTTPTNQNLLNIRWIFMGFEKVHQKYEQKPGCGACTVAVGYSRPPQWQQYLKYLLKCYEFWEVTPKVWTNTRLYNLYISGSVLLPTPMTKVTPAVRSLQIGYKWVFSRKKRWNRVK